ncbi:hypothetical protein [Oryzomonas rubra]|uniref:Uncharacterized protein n=1 Tax=Oryzomonas rubra TaxID=2509454 RepID=A0A5A9X7V0_9BACT|nr:hypothetical protein [Oryzomonas rubra]KAA0888733.1 hypothetical protein ET418_15245 [Oryzomonas rubra]
MVTHKELVKIAEKWLLGTRKCSFAFTELVTMGTDEIPDALGFRDGHSILIECKTSRSDFLADKKKIFRRNPRLGVGTFRLFLCPEGVIRREDLPARWGLIWVNEKGKPRQVVGPKGNAWGYSGLEFQHESNLRAEYAMMASALRRLHLRGVLPMIYEPLKTSTRE